MSVPQTTAYGESRTGIFPTYRSSASQSDSSQVAESLSPLTSTTKRCILGGRPAKNVYRMDSERPAFSTLPGELVEEILIACAANNDPASIAAVAATSRRLNSIIYHNTDHHLWRSLFRTLFDDPRELDRRPASGKHFLTR